MNDETARLIFQLQLEDIQEVSSNSKGKQRAGEISDFEVAMSYYKIELESGTTLVSDRHMCMSIAEAVRRDGELVNELRAQEERAVADRAIAIGSQGGNNPLPHTTNGEPQGPQGEEDSLHDDLLEKLAAMYIFGPECDIDPDSEENQPESSVWAASRANTSKPLEKVAKRQCVTCMEYFEFYDVTQAPCPDKHNYCRGCLRELFHLSLTDEFLFPPRCCGQPIPAETNRIFLTSKLMGEYLAKKLERDTPNRTYCHQPSCSKFIPPPFIQNDVGNCVQCNEKTCVICKGASHGGDCPEDPQLQEILQVARENEWQRCYSCFALVVLESGCYHISKSLPYTSDPVRHWP